jgi:ADP-heptose:LPS heptosyltransferase
MQVVASNAYQDLLPGNFLAGYLVLSLESETQPRLLTDEQIIEMAVMIEKPIVITGLTGDRNLADRIGQSTGCAVLPTCGDLSLPEKVSVTGHAAGVIAFDPFWSKIAAATGKSGMALLNREDIPNLKDIALWARSLVSTKNDRETI